jgi:hypothetical protein
MHLSVSAVRSVLLTQNIALTHRSPREASSCLASPSLRSVEAAPGIRILSYAQNRRPGSKPEGLREGIQGAAKRAPARKGGLWGKGRSSFPRLDERLARPSKRNPSSLNFLSNFTSAAYIIFGKAEKLLKTAAGAMTVQ